MQRRYNRGYFVLVMVVFFGLAALMVGVDAQAQIAFISRKNNNADIYVMDANGGNPRNLTNHLEDDEDPAWYNPALTVAPAGKKFMIWGRVKQVVR